MSVLTVFSLQATWIRNTILRALRDSAQLDTRAIAGGFIYENPTITRLAQFVQSLVSGSYENAVESPMAKGDTMRAMAEKYSADLKPGTESSHDDAARAHGDVVLVTGTTGSLGCHILASLTGDTRVSRIYALNRASEGAGSLRERQRKSLESRALDPSILDSEKIILLEGNTATKNLGLEEHTYLQVCRHVHPLHPHSSSLCLDPANLDTYHSQRCASSSRCRLHAHGL